VFSFKMIGTDGEKVTPESVEASVPSWRPGDEVFIRPGLAYRVVRVEPGEGVFQALLVVEAV
jgi:hypothetical protein